MMAMMACTLGEKEVVRVLLDNNVDTSIRSEDDQTALDIASENKHDEIVDMLRREEN